MAEQEALHKQLQQEQEMLQHFQEKQEIKLLYQQDKEKTALEEKIEKSHREQEKGVSRQIHTHAYAESFIKGTHFN